MRRCGGAVAAAIAVAGLGCTQETISVDVRSLERSGRSAFVCLSAPGTAPGMPIERCSRHQGTSPDDYEVDASGATTLPHLYALVTQTTRGEVAVIDLSTTTGAVLDQNESVPGANFLPIGAQPIDIVATQGGTAAFVSVAEIGREGIFVLPTTNTGANIRPCDGCAAATLSSWPACSLPSAPGDMILVSDPATAVGEVRATCSGSYGDPPPAGNNGDLSLEGLGRQKLIVTLPDLGELVVIDAQTLLDKDRGSYAPCDIEKVVSLSSDVPPGATPAPPPAGAGCVNPEAPSASAQAFGTPRPAGLALSGTRLYVADLEVPAVHVIDMPTPCDAVEREPLLPSSIEDPERVVTTSRLAASPAPTSSFRRYLYAVDEVDGSTMIFDISDDATARTPLIRPHPEWNPFQPPDRIHLSAPVRDLTIIQRDVPATHPATGVAAEGIRCDPDPTLTPCSEGTASCDLETLYRTASDYQSGAGPTKLRGSYAFLMLTNGLVGIIDIDDLDASCRGPRSYAKIAGCPPLSPPPNYTSPIGATSTDLDADGVLNDDDNCPYAANPKVLTVEQRSATCISTKRDALQCKEITFSQPDADRDGIGDVCQPSEALVSSGEASCNVVLPNAPRAGVYLTSASDAGQHEPGLQTFPRLYDRTGTVIPIADDAPIMRATLPVEPGAAQLAVVVGSNLEAIDDATGLIDNGDGPNNTLVMNLEDPRAQVVDQTWALGYEGALPGFVGRVVRLQLALNAPDNGYYGADAAFCSRGVQSAASVREQFGEVFEEEIREAYRHKSPPETPDQAIVDAFVDNRVTRLADVAQIRSELPAEDDPHWSSAAAKGVCDFLACKSEFGTASAPADAREMPITEAYEDHVLVQAPPEEAFLERMKCCFPAQVELNIRTQGQWIAIGATTHFLHHVIADPVTGVCRNTCDPAKRRLNGRVLRAPANQAVRAGDFAAFINPMFRLAISSGTSGTTCRIDDGDGEDECQGGWCMLNPGSASEGVCEVLPQRDMFFNFDTTKSFGALFVNLTRGSTDIQPQAIRFVPATGELAVTDGSLEGLLLVNPGTVSVSRQYY